jgi:hypothetical protein
MSEMAPTPAFLAYAGVDPVEARHPTTETGRERSKLSQVPYFVDLHEIICHAFEIRIHSHYHVQGIGVFKLRSQIFSCPNHEFICESLAALGLLGEVFVLKLISLTQSLFAASRSAYEEAICIGINEH